MNSSTFNSLVNNSESENHHSVVSNDEERHPNRKKSSFFAQQVDTQKNGLKVIKIIVLQYLYAYFSFKNKLFAYILILE